MKKIFGVLAVICAVAAISGCVSGGIMYDYSAIGEEASIGSPGSGKSPVRITVSDERPKPEFAAQNRNTYGMPFPIKLKNLDVTGELTAVLTEKFTLAGYTIDPAAEYEIVVHVEEIYGDTLSKFATVQVEGMSTIRVEIKKGGAQKFDQTYEGYSVNPKAMSGRASLVEIEVNKAIADVFNKVLTDGKLHGAIE